MASSSYPYLYRIRSSRPYIIATVAVAVFSDLFLYGLIVAVLPFSLPSRTGIPQDQVQSWISILLAVFAGACIVGSPPASYLAERMSTRRTPYLVGIVLLIASTIMLCLGRSIAVLLVARILQGASAAMAWVVGPSLVVDTFGTSNDVGEAMGYVGMSAGSATVLGPLLGGVLYSAGGYYAPFGLGFGVLGIDFCLRFFLVERRVLHRLEKGGPSDTHVNAPTTDIEKHDEVPPPGPLPLPAPAPPKPSFPWALLKSPRLLTATLATLAVSILLTSFDATLAIFVQSTFHWSSTGAGLIYLPLMLPSLFAPLLGKLVDTYGSRWLVTMGFLIAVPGFVSLRFVTHTGVEQVILLCALLIIIGCSVAACLTPTMTEMSFVLRERREHENRNAATAIESRDEEGDAAGSQENKTDGMAGVYGLWNAAFAAGNAIGPLWAGYVRDDAGWSVMAWSLSILSGVTAGFTIIWTGGAIYRR